MTVLFILMLQWQLTISSSPRGCACDIHDHLHKWHLHMLLATFLLLVLMVYSLHSFWVWSYAAVPQNCSLSRAMVLLQVHLLQCGSATGILHCYSHLHWRLDHCSCFSLMGSPVTQPCETIHYG
jgi:hypothetical protein